MNLCGFGRTPLAFAGFSDGGEYSSRYLSSREMAAAQMALNLVAELPTEKRIENAYKSVQSLRTLDSLYAKMQRYSAKKLGDTLEAERARADELFPLKGPHQIIYGPHFVSQPRPTKLRGLLGSVISGCLYDKGGLFGDDSWYDLTPSERLSGRRITFLNGPHAGTTYEISAHVLSSSSFIRLLGDPVGDDGGPLDWNFSIDGDSLPDTNVTSDDRGRDWAIATALRGTVLDVVDGTTIRTALAGNPYWYVNGEAGQGVIKRTLQGRTLYIGENEYDVVRHDATDVAAYPLPATPGRLVLNTTVGISPGDAFRVPTISPSKNGKQRGGTLMRPSTNVKFGFLEPTVHVWMHGAKVVAATADDRSVLQREMATIGRYHKMRFHKHTGTAPRLRSAEFGLNFAIERAHLDQAHANEIERIAEELDLPIVMPDE